MQKVGTPHARMRCILRVGPFLPAALVHRLPVKRLLRGVRTAPKIRDRVTPSKSHNRAVRALNRL